MKKRVSFPSIQEMTYDEAVNLVDRLKAELNAEKAEFEEMMLKNKELKSAFQDLKKEKEELEEQVHQSLEILDEVLQD
ncbi:hypothetical protein [Halobacillus massiliensis]|uniref:hypothetical protein n=1 Tax=Halobacillus massiliensis TaxID=1926286 RepID=UPI0009E2242C|nr:hypothetical protein [Halobacillus massiliensis]